MYALVALGLVVVALTLAGFFGFTKGSVLPVVLAVVACVPAAYGFWKGTQDETQKQSALNLLALLLAGAVALLLLILKIVGWVT